jgi:dihydropteroate synthase
VFPNSIRSIDWLQFMNIQFHTQIMGILNITPDSFYDGGVHGDAVSAKARAAEMAQDGADWIDVGGESSRPGAEPIGLDEELKRVVPVLEALQGVDAKVSIDTYRAETARRALALGATMVNDISALRMDPAMTEVMAEAGCPCVLMHMQGTPRDMQQSPEYGDVVDEVCAFFEERLAYAVHAGVKEENIWLDPGFGFGKTVAHNLEMLRRLREFKRLGRPLLLGTSNKSTIGKVLGTTVADRLEGTAATVAAGIMNGADMVRVHDVRAMARVARMTDAILHGGI